MTSKLIEVRGPTAAEATRNAEIVFVRLDARGNHRIVLGGVCHESWEQWGESTEILFDNMPAIEAWRRGMSDVLDMVEDPDTEVDEEEEEEEEA